MPKSEKLNSPCYDVSRLKAAGEDVFISAQVEIRRPHLIYIGSHVAIDTGFYITTAAEIGNFIHIGPYVTVIGGGNGLFKMGDFTNLAAGCRVICVTDTFVGDGLVTTPGIPPEMCRLKNKPVVLQPFANVGTNAVILPGVTLGEGSVIGACSLVTKNTKPWTIYTGIPARPQRLRPKEKILDYARKLGYAP